VEEFNPAQDSRQRAVPANSDSSRMAAAPPFFRPRGSAADVESGASFQPKFDANALIAAIVTDAGSGQVLMFAWMNAESLALSLQTGVAHFWSRSRKKLWKKGEESGNLLDIVDISTDCDQDALVVKATVRGAGVACHTGRKSCFYRALAYDPATGKVALEPV
jgi:phosphoribosyl-AMP cyclohydrolase